MHSSWRFCREEYGLNGLRPRIDNLYGMCRLSRAACLLGILCDGKPVCRAICKGIQATTSTNRFWAALDVHGTFPCMDKVARLFGGRVLMLLLLLPPFGPVFLPLPFGWAILNSHSYLDRSCFSPLPSNSCSLFFFEGLVCDRTLLDACTLQSASCPV